MNSIIEKSWLQVLSKTLATPYFVQLSEKVDTLTKEEDVWPKQENLFKAFDLCPFNKVKVVILGQDPYPTPGHAHGLCFSVPPTTAPLAKSLQNIFKEIQTDLGHPIPQNGNLERWAKQGVFLLNTVLTVKAGDANSHSKIGWQTFTDEVISLLSEKHNGIIFLLWGAQAQKKMELIDTERHHILKAPHPSPLSAYRGFFGCKHFSKTNDLLILQHKEPINW